MKSSRIKYPLAIVLSFFIFTQSIFAGPPPDIVGQSAILIERSTGTVLYQKNASTQMYPASTTKILTAVLSLENLDLYDHLSKTRESVFSVPSDSSHVGLEIGDSFTIIDGVHAVMLGSDNYVSHDLATHLDGTTQAFAYRMNMKAKEIGATNSHFVNPHGYHDPGHYTTAHDLAIIMDYALKNDDFRRIIRSPNYILDRLNNMDQPIGFSNTVKLIHQESPYYRSDVLGGKTGYTRAAGRCLVAAAGKDGMELVGVVLKSTREDFFNDMNTLFDYGFENFALTRGPDPGLVNNSFSPWAKDTVELALKHKLIEVTGKNYQEPISKKDFIQLLMRTAYIAENRDLEDFSSDLAISNALEWGLIGSDSLLSGFNHPINRESSADLTAKLLSFLNCDPVAIYPTSPYADGDGISPSYIDSVNYLQQRAIMGSTTGGYFSPQEALTYESALTLATKFYQHYWASPYSSINKIKKRLL